MHSTASGLCQTLGLPLGGTSPPPAAAGNSTTLDSLLAARCEPRVPGKSSHCDLPTLLSALDAWMRLIELSGPSVHSSRSIPSTPAA